MIKWINILHLVKKTSLRMDVGGGRIMRKTVFLSLVILVEEKREE
jgi:hypothetical protein